MISKTLRSVIDAIPADFADPAADYLAVRAMFSGFHGHSVGEDLAIRFQDYGGIRCGHYILPALTGNKIIVHCHGGAFVSTPLDDYHFYAELIARRTGCQVVMPDYRLAPEHRFPAAHDDCFNAYRGLLEAGIDPGTIIIAGESCGGSLGLGLLVRARDAGLPLPAAFVSLTGWFDLSVSGVPVGGQDPFLTPEWVRNRGRDYLGNAQADTRMLSDPQLSPAYADLHGLPPMYLQIAQYDTLREGQLLLGANALRAGVNVTVESWPGCIHGWHGLVSAQVPEADAAWKAIRRYIDDLPHAADRVRARH